MDEKNLETLAGGLQYVDIELNKMIALADEIRAKGYAGKMSVQKMAELIRSFQPLPSYDPVFANNSWADIQKAINEKNVPDTWKPGDSKPMTLSTGTYDIAILGKNHDEYTSGGIAPLTFCYGEVKDPEYPESEAGPAINNTSTNAGGWRDSDLRNGRTEYYENLLQNELASFPAEVQVKAVNKVCGLGSLGGVATVSDKLFLPAEGELFAARGFSQPEEFNAVKKYAGTDVLFKSLTSSTLWTRSAATTEKQFVRCSGVGDGRYTPQQGDAIDWDPIILCFCL